MIPQISLGGSPPPPAAPHPMTGTNNESAPHWVTQIPGTRPHAASHNQGPPVNTCREPGVCHSSPEQ